MTYKGELPHVVIGLARCSRLKDVFGIRFQEMRNGVWAGTWAFKIKEDTAKREGYQSAVINGTFDMTDYPGCPHCGSKGFFVCGNCGKIGCLDSSPTVTCRWCGRNLTIQLRETLEFETGKDR